MIKLQEKSTTTLSIIREPSAVLQSIEGSFLSEVAFGGVLLKVVQSLKPESFVPHLGFQRQNKPAATSEKKNINGIIAVFN